VVKKVSTFSQAKTNQKSSECGSVRLAEGSYMEIMLAGVVLLLALGAFVRAVRVKKVVIEFDRNEKPPKQLNH
jgi:hypothetical protein